MKDKSRWKKLYCWIWTSPTRETKLSLCKLIRAQCSAEEHRWSCSQRPVLLVPFYGCPQTLLDACTKAEMTGCNILQETLSPIACQVQQRLRGRWRHKCFGNRIRCTQTHTFLPHTTVGGGPPRVRRIVGLKSIIFWATTPMVMVRCRARKGGPETSTACVVGAYPLRRIVPRTSPLLHTITRGS